MEPTFYSKIQKLKDRIIEIERKASVLYGGDENYTGPKVVVYGGTENCYEDMERSAKMLLANSHVDKIYFLIDTDEFPVHLPDIIEAINVHDQSYFFPWSPCNQNPVSYMTMMRHTLYDMFPQYDRILWLDCDTIVMDDIAELFNTPMGNYYYYAAVPEDRHYIQYTSTRKILDVQDPYHEIELEKCKYYSAGVLLENTKLLREDGLGEKIVNRLNNYLIHYCDQTVINEICRDRIYTLKAEWNSGHNTDIVMMPKIMNMPKDNKTIPMKHAIKEYDESVSFEDIVKWREKREKAGVLNGNNGKR